MSVPQIRPIETRYAGCRFRSRTEARWAVFMDTLGVPWVYEKEGYDLGELGWYLPDFWLPSLDCWLEIKPSIAVPDPPTILALEKCSALARLTKKPAYIFADCLPTDLSEKRGDGPWPAGISGRLKNTGIILRTDGTIDVLDRKMSFGVCYYCGKVGIGVLGEHGGLQEDEGHRKGYPEIAPGGVSGIRIPPCLHEKIIHAFSVARSARFEKGA